MATLSGDSGNNTLAGTSSDDTISGLAGDDILNGGDGNDTLKGGAGADALNGGSGSDTASYAGSVAVNVNLKTGITSGGDAVGDKFDSIENLTGSSNADTLTGDDGDNVINGGGGNDTLDGGKGADTLQAGGGSDTVTYVNSDAAVNVSVSVVDGHTTGSGSGGDAQGDTYLDIAYVVGSQYDDRFSGKGRAYDFAGGLGNDTYEIATATITVTEAQNAGNDTVLASVNYTLSDYVETLKYTGAGDFTGTGSAQANTIVGGSGNDTLTGKAGADVLIGGSGSDTASYAGSAAVNVDLKTGITSGGDAVGDKFDSIENLTGSSNADTLTGDDGDNVINGGGGNDTLDGGKGADTLQAGGGSDTVTYVNSDAAVNVSVSVVDGHTTGSGSGGDAQGDTYLDIAYVVGSQYDDRFSGKGRAYDFAGGLGNDTYEIATATITVTEAQNAGNDTVLASVNYTLSDYVETLKYTGAGDFTGTGSAQANTIVGGSGNDTLIGKAGADVLIGGSGSDTASYAGSAAVNVNLKTNLATGGEAEGDTFSSVENLTGSSYADTLTGNDSNNVLNGGDDNDTLAGGKGADTLNGGNGSDTANYADSFAAIQINLVTGTHTGGDAADDTLSSIEGVIGSQYDDRFTSASTGTLSGGGGNDTYVVSQIATTTVLVEEASAGTDTVETTLTSYTLKTNFENLTHTDSTNFLGYGNNADNVIVSQGGVDKLYGYAGNDTIRGGSGGDTIDGGDGSDTASYSDSTAAVTINLLSKTVSGGYAAGDVFTSIENVEGSAYADTLTGDTGANVLSGGAGDDILVGGAGADTLNGGAGQDKITYEASSAAVKVDLSTGTATGGDAQGDKLSSIERVIGSSFNDTLIGSSAAEMLTGGAGDDILIGGGGNDVLNGGEGADVLDGGAGNYDTLNYSAATSAVALDLTTGTGSGYAAGDTFTGIEAFTGSIYGDTYTGSTYAAEYNVGAGNDTVLAGSGAEKINGGAGTDTASYALSTAGVSVNLVTNVGSGGYAEGDQYSSIEVVIGSDYSDTFTTNTDKTLLGGLGDDTYDIGSSASTITENADAGTDLVKTSSASYTLGDNLENLTYTGTANFTGSGNSADNVLTGGAGDDVLDGSTGNDALYGGEGSDVFVFNASYGNDVVFDFQASSDTIDLTGMGFATVSDAAAYASEIEDGVLFNFGNGDTLTVHGLNYASLTSSDSLM
ncbi:calcium-binding protein [Agrobacterium vitis]|uniref:beta strand repeat-containing protein n=1 Tax=Allorhizobium ampelinum TaxID=3025782 RepID=UPI002279DAA3|nr:calcium-binding protein [Allorhizobium ampelinum]MCF1462406.1 calcium-binding protein [Allorhizobium ampelinum]